MLAAKVLRLTNSPFYRFPSRIGSVSHAVIVLGFNAVKGLTTLRLGPQYHERFRQGAGGHSVETLTRNLKLDAFLGICR